MLLPLKDLRVPELANVLANTGVGVALTEPWAETIEKLIDKRVVYAGTRQ